MAIYKRNRGVELGIVISRFDVRRPDYSTALPQGKDKRSQGSDKKTYSVLGSAAEHVVKLNKLMIKVDYSHCLCMSVGTPHKIIEPRRKSHQDVLKSPIGIPLKWFF